MLPGQAKKDITAMQAKAILAGIRPRDVGGKTRPRTSTLRISHFPGAHTRRCPAPSRMRTPARLRLFAH
jgi:transposase